jgi:hypothetical protein
MDACLRILRICILTGKLSHNACMNDVEVGEGPEVASLGDAVMMSPEEISRKVALSRGSSSTKNGISSKSTCRATYRMCGGH